MGCGALGGSAKPIEIEEKEQDVDEAKAEAQQKAQEAKPQELKVDLDGDGKADGEGIMVLDQRKGKKFEKQDPFLPFVRFDKSAVPKALFTADQIYVYHVRSEKYFCSSDGSAISCTADGVGTASLFDFENAAKQQGSPVTDGDTVMLRHYESGNYLTCKDDSGDLTLEPRREVGNSPEFQTFQITKYSRPMALQHDDVFFLESWLSNFLEADYGTEKAPLRAHRWKRGKPQMFTFQKKAVLEAKTTDVARAMQFQSFDLDGNAMITKGEASFMLKQIQLEDDKVDEFMQAVGGGTKEEFITGVQNSFLTESQLQHIEALGNIAQRCYDCLHEENCLIEVLTTIPVELVKPTADEYKALTGRDLKEDLIQKCGKDGYIRTNWWMQAMTQMLVDPVEAWCQALQDAMDGLGTDEETLTALVCTIPEELHYDIHMAYKKRKGKSLLEHIQSETSFSYKKVLLAQCNTAANARVEALRNAMQGMGTDELQIIRIITAADAGDRKEMLEIYEKQYDRSLVEHIESEISGDFKKVMHAIFTTEPAPYDLEADCDALKAAMDGWGTDEEALIKLLCSKTYKQMEDIRKKFHDKFGRRLEDRVEKETSKYFQDVLLGLIRDPIKELAHAVHYCIKGFGTDETGLITLLSHLPEYKRIALRKEYQRLFKKDLLKAIEGDTSGNFKQALLACVKLPPVVWAEALDGAMRGFGTSDGLLINFMCLAKNHMDEVRAEFEEKNKKPLWKWIDGDCSGDYKNTLIALAQRNSEDRIEMLPIWWAQRLVDALDDANSLKTLMTSPPAIVLVRASTVYQAVYQESLADAITKKCKEGKGFSFFTDWWKVAMLRNLEMPLDLRCSALKEAMDGIGTDEFSLTACIMTIPENTHQAVQDMYANKYGKKLVDRIESETSFAYKKIMRYATLSKVESRCVALYNAMNGMGTDEGQLIRIIACATFKERELIREKYFQMYDRDLIAQVEGETSGHFKNALVAILESNNKNWNPDYDKDVDDLQNAMDGMGTDEDALIRIIAAKSDDQIERLCEVYKANKGADLLERVDSETFDWGLGPVLAGNFRQTMLTLLRPRKERLARCTRYCMQGWGTDDTGLITCVVHLTEMERIDLIRTYSRIFNRKLIEDIRSETSGDYETALVACLEPQVNTYVRAIRKSMKGLGTSDNLLINWMVLCKDRMDEVRAEWPNIHEGEDLVSWVEGDCSGDYKDTLVRLAKRDCVKFEGVEVACTVPAPPSQEESILRFNKTFNKLCRMKKKNPNVELVIPEDAQQELGCAFLFWGAKSSCKPNLDMAGLMDMTMAIGGDVGFAPHEHDGLSAEEDLRDTFREWDVSGSGEIDWNDFVTEMTVRVNDPTHWRDMKPLRESACEATYSLAEHYENG